MAADQRYCLNCGHRRGDPRLPFMDAVVFMESMGSAGAGASSPPPPPGEQKSSPRMNANAALIAGVATLVLAIGVGFLIGRSGHENSTQAAAPIRVVQVGGGEGGATESEAASEESTAGTNESSTGKSGSKNGGSKSKSPKATPKAEENSQVGSHGASKATEEVLHTEGNVKLAEPKTKVGGSCTEGTAGCKGKEFTGEFFGE